MSIPRTLLPVLLFINVGAFPAASQTPPVCLDPIGNVVPAYADFTIPDMAFATVRPPVGPVILYQPSLLTAHGLLQWFVYHHECFETDTSTIKGAVASAASTIRVGYPQASTTTPEIAPAEAPASPITRSDRPWAEARICPETDSLSSVDPATIVADHPRPSIISPPARRAG